MSFDGVLQSEGMNMVTLMKTWEGEWLIGELMDTLRVAEGRTPLDFEGL
jgi:hypothetical protein